MSAPPVGTQIIPGPEKTDGREKHVTVTHGARGFFAVMLWWNPDYGGFWEPWNTGVGTYPTSKGAEDEARAWAKAEDLEYRPPKRK